MSDEDNEHLYQIEEIVFGALALMAPPGVKESLVRLISCKISKKAGQEARELLEDTEDSFKGGVLTFMETAADSLDPELVGPKSKSPEGFEEVMEFLATSGILDSVVDMACTTEAAEDGKQTPSGGCKCPRCQFLRGMDAAGIEIYRGSAVSKKDLN